MTINFSLDTIKEAAAEFLAAVHANRVIAFEGDMGAGKTTFIQALCTVMGVKGHVSSPTFSIINEYLTQDGHAIYHMDFYRLLSDEEAVRAGAEDALYSGSYCFVEWPQRAPGILPPETLHCTLSIGKDGERQLQIKM